MGEVVIQNTKNCDVPFVATINDEKTETPQNIPEVTDFSFGKFDYNLLELPIEGYSLEQSSLSLTDSRTSRKKELWNEVKRKHMQSLYGKSVNIIVPDKTRTSLDKELKDAETKSLKRYRLKSSKSRSMLDIKKRTVFKKTFSGTSVTVGKRESKSSEGRKGSLIAVANKPIFKIGAKRTDPYEFNFSDLVKIGKTHIIMPTNIPQTVMSNQMESSSECFSINVTSGTLKPKEIVTYTVKFTPKHIKNFKADLR